MGKLVFFSLNEGAKVDRKLGRVYWHVSNQSLIKSTVEKYSKGHYWFLPIDQLPSYNFIFDSLVKSGMIPVFKERKFTDNPTIAAYFENPTDADLAITALSKEINKVGTIDCETDKWIKFCKAHVSYVALSAARCSEPVVSNEKSEISIVSKDVLNKARRQFSTHVRKQMETLH